MYFWIVRWLFIWDDCTELYYNNAQIFWGWACRETHCAGSFARHALPLSLKHILNLLLTSRCLKYPSAFMQRAKNHHRATGLPEQGRAKTPRVHCSLCKLSGWHSVRDVSSTFNSCWWCQGGGGGSPPTAQIIQSIEAHSLHCHVSRLQALRRSLMLPSLVFLYLRSCELCIKKRIELGFLNETWCFL